MYARFYGLQVPSMVMVRSQVTLEQEACFCRGADLCLISCTPFSRIEFSKAFLLILHLSARAL